MTASLVERVSEDHLAAEKAQLLSAVGMTEQKLLERGQSWALDTEDQWRAFSRLENIRFLLGEDA